MPNLPDRSSPNLGGAYGHELKNIAVGPDQKLYVDIASASNSDPADTSNPLRCAIYRYDLDGGNRELAARGIRNAEGLASRFCGPPESLIVPVSSKLEVKCGALRFQPPERHDDPIAYQKTDRELSILASRNRSANDRVQTAR